MNWDIRRADQDDLANMLTVGCRAFGVHSSPEFVEHCRPRFEPERNLLAHDPADDTMIGTAGSYTFDVTMPAPATSPTPPTVLPTQGVTLVTVAATHRRRGILRALMTEQLRGFAAEGLALSVLLASESGIYRRFGYGPVGRTRKVRIGRPLVRFRADAPDPGGVRFVDVDKAGALAPDVHRRWAARTPGAVSRDERWWTYLLRDPEYCREGGTPLVHLAHQDGYASYRIADGVCRVQDFFAVTEQAHAALWRVLLGMDLISMVTTEWCPLDDPLPHLLTEPRLVRTTTLEDGLWARILDVPAALSARRYGVELDLVLEMDDAFLGRGGRFRLRGGPDGACCEPAGSSTAQVRLDVATLAMLLFGTHRATELARAGLLAGAPAVLARCDLAFAAERAVVHGSDF